MRRKINIDKYRSMLLSERERIAREIMEMQKEVWEVDGDEVKDVGDMSISCFSQEMLSSLEEEERKILMDIERALEKIRNGTYGICENCGEEIEEKRLDVKPYARFCVKCREKLEKKGLV